MASIHKRMVGKEPRYDVSYREPDGRQRRRSFKKKVDAETFKSTVEADVLRGTYLDPDAGKITFKSYAERWITDQYRDDQASTREAVELRLRLHVYPTLGSKMLGQIKVSTLRSWVSGLKSTVKSEAYRRVIVANVSAILSTAVEEERIPRNYLKSEAVRKLASSGETSARRIVPWSVERVALVRRAVSDQYRVAVDLAAGLGLRQGEVFGLSPDDVDFLRGTVTVQRQVKVLGGSKLVFGLPKGRKVREVPLPASVRDVLAEYLAARPARAVTLPWESLQGKLTTVNLVLTTREHSALNRNYFNSYVWRPALATAGVESGRENGMHALRHHYASVLLDAGENIKAVSEYLGHADAGFTLRIYTHLMPASSERTMRAVDAAFACYMGVESVRHIADSQA